MLFNSTYIFVYSYIFCIVLDAAFPKHLLEIPGINRDRAQLFMKQIIILYNKFCILFKEPIL